MVNQDIVNYLSEGRKRGFSINLLRQKLQEGGFQDKDIEEAVGVAEKEDVKKESFKPEGPEGKSSITIGMDKEKKPVDKKGSGAGGKWMKIGGWMGVLALIFGLIYAVLAYFISDTVIISLIFLIILILLSVFYYVGFVKLGKHAESKLVGISAWILLILAVITIGLFMFSDFGSSSPSSAEKIINISFLVLVGLLTIMCLVFSVGLIKIADKVRFAKGAGYLNIIIFILVIVLVVLAMFDFEVVSDLVSDLLGGDATFGVLSGAGVLLISTVAVGLGVVVLRIIAMILEIMVLFNGSKKFEQGLVA